MQVNWLGYPGTLGTPWHHYIIADAWIIPKGAPNRDVAMDFINFATRSGPQADFARLLPYGPVNERSLELLPEERRLILPTAPANRAVQFVQNWNWWADNYDAALARFDEWLLTPPEATPSP